MPTKNRSRLWAALSTSVFFAALLPLFLMFLSATTSYFVDDMLTDSPTWRRITAVFSACLIPLTYRLLLGIALTGKPTEKHLISRYSAKEPSHIPFFGIFSDGFFWLWCLPTLLLALLLPVGAGYTPILHAVYGDTLPTGVVAKLTASAVLPLYFLFTLTAYRKAARRCLESEETPPARRKRQKNTVRHLMTVFSLIGTAAIGPFVIMLAVTLWNFLGAFFPIILAVILFLASIRSLRAIRIRRGFLKELRSRDENKRIRLGEIPHPILSLFSVRYSQPFPLHANGKTYTCRMIASLNRKKHIHLRDDGTGYFIRRFHLPLFMPVVRSRKGARVVDVRDQGELFHIKQEFRYAFEGADGQKLLIVLPVPQELRAMRGEDLALLNPGDSIGGYKVYNAATFLSHLDMGLFDR